MTRDPPSTALLDQTTKYAVSYRPTVSITGDIAITTVRRFPVRGAGRGLMALARVFPSWRAMPLRMIDGRVLTLDLSSVACMSYALKGNIHEEHGETILIRSALRPGDVGVDIGANVGWYMTLMAETVGESGQVWAFEPHPNMARLLRATAAQYPTVTVKEQALTDTSGDAVLHVGYDEGQSTIGDAPGARVTVKVTTLDDAVPDGITLIKCDAEGAELAILRGAAQHLAGDRPPMWLLEWGSLTAGYFGGYTTEDITALFDDRYEALWVDRLDGTLRPPPAVEGRHNMVLVPEWLADRVAHLRQPAL